MQSGHSIPRLKRAAASGKAKALAGDVWRTSTPLLLAQDRPTYPTLDENSRVAFHTLDLRPRSQTSIERTSDRENVKAPPSYDATLQDYRQFNRWSIKPAPRLFPGSSAS